MPPAPIVRKGARVDIYVARQPIQALHVRIMLLAGTTCSAEPTPLYSPGSAERDEVALVAAALGLPIDLIAARYKAALDFGNFVGKPETGTPAHV